MSVIFLMSATSCSVRLLFLLPNCVSTLGYFLSGDFREKIQHLIHFESPLIFALSLTDEQTFFNSSTIFLMFVFRMSFPSLAAPVPPALLSFLSRSVQDLPSSVVYSLGFPIRSSLIFRSLIRFIGEVLFLVPYVLSLMCFPAGL